MRTFLPLLAALSFISLCIPANSVLAQKDKKEKGKYDPPDKLFPPSEDLLKQIETKTAQLHAKIAELRKNPKAHDLLPDVEIYLRGAENIVRFKEWFSKDSGKWTLDALDAGLLRADQLAQGKSPWTTLEKRNVLRAYRSLVDDTAQPFGVTYPLEYGKDPNRKWRVDFVLHGRNSSFTEVQFINSQNGKKKIDPEQDWVQIDIAGRGNNAYRWAGETDVLEAIAFSQIHEIWANRPLLDYRRRVLRGFSMGGAGTWHLGLHFPERWCVIGPGAGFTSTHGYAWQGRKDLPDYQERCLRIYDAVDYAENARQVPIVAYSGGDDPQKRAADNIERRLKDLKVDLLWYLEPYDPEKREIAKKRGAEVMTHIVAPGLGHAFPPDWFKKVNERLAFSVGVGARTTGIGEKLSFVTYTTKYSRMDWVEVTALEKHYEKAFVEAKVEGDSKVVVTTKNVRGLHLRYPFSAVVIDGQKIAVTDVTVNGKSFMRESGKWGLEKEREPMQKSGGLQGPIDDAFASGFLCVVGSGETWHPSTQKFVDAKLGAFKYDWGKHWRGELPTTGDYALTPNDIKDKHLILFGDPQSNLTLAQVLPKLPLKWTKDEIEFAGKKYSAAEHVPVMIFPNPLNPSKYVVLNTGHTWPSEDYVKTNAMLYPRLGDYAILRMTPTAKNAAAYEVATAGLFDEFWQVDKK